MPEWLAFLIPTSAIYL